MAQVVAESYEEMVFSEPTEGFHSRVTAAPPNAVPANSLSQHFPANSVASAPQQLHTLNVARQKNAQIMANLQAQLTRYG